jgi:3-(3-hydroxy-phenyl)propionate hydroxylase
MFSQPAVETAARDREKLDDVIGPWFAVIGVHVDPADHLPPDLLAWWESLGARFLRVDPSRSGPRPGASVPVTPVDGPESSSVVLEDVDGAFRDWLLARPQDEIIVLRPDRYVAAACDRASFASTSTALRALLGGSAG